ncbi:MAG: DUF4160 domain-containing protein [Bacteroidota bacterium]
MPTVFREGPYRVYFVSHDLKEPPHVHVDREKYSAKFWLQPVAFARNLGFSAQELRTIERMIAEHEQECMEVWNDNFKRQRG